MNIIVSCLVVNTNPRISRIMLMTQPVSLHSIITVPAYYSPEPSARSKRQANPGNGAEKLASYWNAEAQQTLQQQLRKELNFNVAKNVILFLGDGMSIPTLAAARAYMGKLGGALSGGEETHLFFDDFPHTGLSKVSGKSRDGWITLHCSSYVFNFHQPKYWQLRINIQQPEMGIL